MLDLLKKHPVAGIFCALGGVMTAGGLILDGMEIATAGYPGWVWATVGAVLFMFSIVAVVSKQHEQLVEMQNASEAPKAKKRPGIPKPTAIDFEGPDYSNSDLRDRFDMVEAACLWAGVAPNSDPVVLGLFPEANNCYSMLVEAIEDGDLPCFTSHNPPRKTKDVKPAWRVYRKDLVALAEKKQVKPKFLFPEARGRRV